MAGATPTPEPNRLRALILQFYSANDPGKLKMGLDVNGMVEWTSRNGIDALNQMLLNQFNKVIDVNLKVGNKRDQFKRMSNAFTPNVYADIQAQSAAAAQKEKNKEMTIRIKLQKFYMKNDPSKVQNMDKLVKFAMYHGEDKLNEKLQGKYGYGLESVSTDDVSDDEDLDDGNNIAQESVAENQLHHSIDKGKVKKDLIKFLKSENDDEQLEVVDEMVDWASKIGMEEFNEKLEQMYGISLEDKLKDLERQRRIENAGSVDRPRSEYSEIEATPFAEMTDDDIREELIRFYSRHDMSIVERISDVIHVAKQLGREDLNGKLTEIYGENLIDVENEGKEPDVPSSSSMEDRHDHADEQVDQPPAVPARTNNPNTGRMIPPPGPNASEIAAAGTLPRPPPGLDAPPGLNIPITSPGPSLPPLPPHVTPLPAIPVRASNAPNIASDVPPVVPRRNPSRNDLSNASDVPPVAPRRNPSQNDLKISRALPSVPGAVSNSLERKPGVLSRMRSSKSSKKSRKGKKKRKKRQPGDETTEDGRSNNGSFGSFGSFVSGNGSFTELSIPPPVAAQNQSSPPDMNQMIRDKALARERRAQEQKADGTLTNNNIFGPCNHYQLDMSGATFGACQCGFPKKDHKKTLKEELASMDIRNSRGTPNVAKLASVFGKKATAAPIPVPNSQYAGSFLNKKDKPVKRNFLADNVCSNYTLDLTSAKDDCINCGFSKPYHWKTLL